MSTQPTEPNSNPKLDTRSLLKALLVALPLGFFFLLGINFLFSPLSWFNQEFMPQYGPFHITFAVMGALLGLVFVVVSMSSQTWPTLARVLAILVFVATSTNVGFLSFKGFFPAPISMVRDGVYEVVSSVQSGGKTYSLLLPFTRSFPTPGTTASSVEKSDENTQNPATWSSYFKSRLSYLKDQLLRAATWFGYYVYPGPGLKPTTPVYCCTDSPLPAGAKYVTVEYNDKKGTTIKEFVGKVDSK